MSLKRQVTSKAQRDLPPLSDRAQREQRIRLLKQSLPQQTELAHIFAMNPEEGEKLAAYCRQVIDRISELEEEHHKACRQEEKERHGKVRERAKERQEQKRAATVQGWLSKEFGAEDRVKELSQRRSEERQSRKQKLSTTVESRHEVRESQFQQRESHLRQKIRAWEEDVIEIERKKREDRKKWEYQTHARSLNYEKVKANLEHAERTHRAHMQEVSDDLDYDLALHAYRAQLIIDSKAERAVAKLRKVSRPNVAKDWQEERRQKLIEKEERHMQNLSQVASEKEKQEQERLERQRVKAERAQKRVKDQQEEEARRLEALAKKIRQREEYLTEKREERSMKLAKQSENKNSRVAASKASKEEQRHLKDLTLAQKWADRAVRIGEMAGVSSPERVRLIEDKPDNSGSGFTQAVISAAGGSEAAAWLHCLSSSSTEQRPAHKSSRVSRSNSVTSAASSESAEKMFVLMRTIIAGVATKKQAALGKYLQKQVPEMLAHHVPPSWFEKSTPSWLPPQYAELFPMIRKNTNVLKKGVPKKGKPLTDAQVRQIFTKDEQAIAMQALGRHRLALRSVEQKKNDARPTEESIGHREAQAAEARPGGAEEHHVVALQKLARNRSARKAVEQKRAKSRERQAEVGEGSTRENGQDSLESSQKELAARAIQSSQRRRRAKESVERQRSMSRDRQAQSPTAEKGEANSQAGAGPGEEDSQISTNDKEEVSQTSQADQDSLAASQKDEATRLIQSVGRRRAAENEVQERRRRSMSPKAKDSTSS